MMYVAELRRQYASVRMHALPPSEVRTIAGDIMGVYHVCDCLFISKGRSLEALTGSLGLPPTHGLHLVVLKCEKRVYERKKEDMASLE